MNTTTKALLPGSRRYILSGWELSFKTTRITCVVSTNRALLVVKRHYSNHYSRGCNDIKESFLMIYSLQDRATIIHVLYTFQDCPSFLTHPERRPTKYLFPRGNTSLLYHQIGNRNFFIFITNQSNLMFCVDKIKYEHLAILSNLKSCQFAPGILIFNLYICCQFEDSQIISPEIIPMGQHLIVTK